MFGVAEKFDDHAGKDDGEQRLPVEVVGEPENVEIDLIEDGHAPLCRGALAVYHSPRAASTITGINNTSNNNTSIKIISLRRLT
jgi:hypothetical protein